jgi:hypothetical protein
MSDEWRMYGLVPYNLSEIQKGIQFGHAVVEYSRLINTFSDSTINAYDKWVKHNKTFIILNGGTTNNNPLRLGSLNQHLNTLIENGIDVATFYETDLGDQLTAVVFLVNNVVYNKTHDDETFNSLKDRVIDKNLFGDDKSIFLRTFLADFKLA